MTNLDYDAVCACAQGCKLLGAMLKNMASDRANLAETYFDDWYGGHRDDYDQLSAAQAEELEELGQELIEFGLDLASYGTSNRLVDMDVLELFESFD